MENAEREKGKNGCTKANEYLNFTIMKKNVLYSLKTYFLINADEAEISLELFQGQSSSTY